MKILILANDDDGLYRFRKDLINELIKCKHSVAVAVPKGSQLPKITALGCEVVETPLERRGMNPAKDIRLLNQYLRIMKETKPDMVVTYTIKPNIYGGLAAKKANIPYCINITGLGTAFQKDNLVKKLVVALYKLACRRAKVVFFENEGNRQLFVKLGIVHEERTCRLNGAGVNVQEFPFSEYPPEQNNLRFLFVGRIMKEKGIEELLQAFCKLESVAKNKGMQVSLDILGTCEEECYPKQMAELARTHKLKYHGFREDVKYFMEHCHCLILPSYHEGMANVLLEAGAMGRPLITSDIHGCKEAINGKNGYTVPCRDAEALYDAMKKFTELPPEEKANMGAESHDYIAKLFSKEKVVEETIRRMME